MNCQRVGRRALLANSNFGQPRGEYEKCPEAALATRLIPTSASNLTFPIETTPSSRYTPSSLTHAPNVAKSQSDFDPRF